MRFTQCSANKSATHMNTLYSVHVDRDASQPTQCKRLKLVFVFLKNTQTLKTGTCTRKQMLNMPKGRTDIECRTNKWSVDWLIGRSVQQWHFEENLCKWNWFSAQFISVGDWWWTWYVYRWIGSPCTAYYEWKYNGSRAKKSMYHKANVLCLWKEEEREKKKIVILLVVPLLCGAY